MINQIKKEESDAINNKFKANDIPITTKIPIYNSIITKNEEKRKKVREESAKML